MTFLCHYFSLLIVPSIVYYARIADKLHFRLFHVSFNVYLARILGTYTPIMSLKKPMCWHA